MFEESAALSIWASMNSWLTPTVLFLLLNLMIGTIAIASSLSSPKPHDQVEPQQHHRGLVRSTSVLQRFKSINFYSYRSQEPDTHFGHDPTKQLVRSSSILQRLQSIKFQFHFPRPNPTHDVILPQTETETRLAHYASEDNSSDNEGREDHDDDVDKFEAGHEDLSLDEIYKQLQMERHASRTTSDTKPASGEVPAKLPRKMRKSASAKSAFGHFAAEEDDVAVVERRRPATVREMKSVELDDDDDVDGGEVDAKADDFINRFKQQLKLQRIDSFIRYKDMIKKGCESK